MGGGYKEMPTSVKQIFVTSDFTMTLFIYRKVAFCWCLLVPVDGGLPVLCDLSSANMRLLTLVMTTWGQVYHGCEGVLFPFSLGATQIPVPVRLSLGIHLCQDCGSEPAAETRAETLHGHFSSITEGPVPVLLHLGGFRQWKLQAALGSSQPTQPSLISCKGRTWGSGGAAAAPAWSQA